MCCSLFLFYIRNFLIQFSFFVPKFVERRATNTLSLEFLVSLCTRSARKFEKTVYHNL
ncbi:hypothetical protein GcM3_c15683o13 [Golovinomyces cichoracearum]|uniref:Uncharacterized protein n=1 Tax=Golovinomyces cichoracearum TaxID=62708 RepID=A0A420J117_9PEZI|nr:hypothetical protein GcM3_c15683o13 [Golovinomyces cichoracearum]